MSLPTLLRQPPTLRPALARTLASHAYNPPRPAFTPGPPGPPPAAKAGPSTPRAPPNPATTTSPTLPPDHRRLLEEIVRVDHAGELGANWIYRGQKWGSQMRGDKRTAEQVEVSLWRGVRWLGQGRRPANNDARLSTAMRWAVGCVMFLARP